MAASGVAMETSPPLGVGARQRANEGLAVGQPASTPWSKEEREAAKRQLNGVAGWAGEARLTEGTVVGSAAATAEQGLSGARRLQPEFDEAVRFAAATPPPTSSSSPSNRSSFHAAVRHLRPWGSPPKPAPPLHASGTPTKERWYRVQEDYYVQRFHHAMKYSPGQRPELLTEDPEQQAGDISSPPRANRALRAAREAANATVGSAAAQRLCENTSTCRSQQQQQQQHPESLRWQQDQQTQTPQMLDDQHGLSLDAEQQEQQTRSLPAQGPVSEVEGATAWQQQQRKTALY